VYVRLSAYKFSASSVAIARSSSDGTAVHYVLSFVDDIMFSHNGANGPASKTMHASFSSRGGDTGVKSAFCAVSCSDLVVLFTVFVWIYSSCQYHRTSTFV